MDTTFGPSDQQPFFNVLVIVNEMPSLGLGLNGLDYAEYVYALLMIRN